MSISYIGVDVSKLKLDFAIKTKDGFITLVFENNKSAFRKLIESLHSYNIKNYHFCCEATGIYWYKFANFCFENDYKISVVNPVRIKNYAKVVMQRIKNDKSDACLIADFCSNQNPSVWLPESNEQILLTAFIRELDTLKVLRTQESNRLLVAHDAVKIRIQERIDLVELQVRELTSVIQKHINASIFLSERHKLLKSIPSVGNLTSAWLLSLFVDASKFDKSGQAVSFIGLSPREYQSGSSVRGRASISKIGDSAVRKALYMPAMVAYSRLEVFKPFVDRLRKAGKPAKVIIVALMRKLVVIAHAILKSGKPFCEKRFLVA